MGFPFGVAFVGHRDVPGGIDPETGDPRPGTVTTYTLTGCVVTSNAELGATGSTERPAQGRDITVTTRTLYAPYGSDVRREDRGEYDGVLYQVVGDPVHERSPLSGNRAYTKAALEVIVGPRT